MKPPHAAAAGAQGSHSANTVRGGTSGTRRSRRSPTGTATHRDAVRRLEVVAHFLDFAHAALPIVDALGCVHTAICYTGCRVSCIAVVSARL
ncbi:unnamed protein product [Ectocarpus sp. 13 AM-2016]